MKYAVSAATGHFGRLAVKDLVGLVGKNNVIALARNVAKAKKVLPQGVAIRPGDYTDKVQLTRSLKGVDKLLMISSMPGKVSRAEQHRNMIEAAKADGVKYLVYTSFPHADRTTSAFAADHRTTEKMLKKSGLHYSVVRKTGTYGMTLPLSRVLLKASRSFIPPVTVRSAGRPRPNTPWAPLRF